MTGGPVRPMSTLMSPSLRKFSGNTKHQHTVYTVFYIYLNTGDTSGNMADTCSFLDEVCQNVRHLVDLFTNLQQGQTDIVHLTMYWDLSAIDIKLCFTRSVKVIKACALTCPLTATLTVNVRKLVKSFLSQFGLKTNMDNITLK